jgi:DNA-binding response OmpR family regulator
MVLVRLPMEQPAYRQILIIDGDPAARQTLVQSLTRAGHVAYTAANGADALTYMMEAEPDLIISEYAMGRVSGREWLQFLEQHFASTQILIVTNLPSRLVGSRWPVLRKPLDLDLLDGYLKRSATALGT